MPDYKELYGKLYRATEKAAFLLRQAQEECESMMMADFDPAIDESRYPILSQKEESQDLETNSP